MEGLIILDKKTVNSYKFMSIIRISYEFLIYFNHFAKKGIA
jgi:hypothetical protein